MRSSRGEEKTTDTSGSGAEEIERDDKDRVVDSVKQQCARDRLMETLDREKDQDARDEGATGSNGSDGEEGLVDTDSADTGAKKPTGEEGVTGSNGSDGEEGLVDTDSADTGAQKPTGEEGVMRSNGSDTEEGLVATDSADTGAEEPAVRVENPADDDDDDLEEGELREEDASVQQAGVRVTCTLYMKGSCLKGHKCPFFHPVENQTQKGNCYQMFEDQQVKRNPAPISITHCQQWRPQPQRQSESFYPRPPVVRWDGHFTPHPQSFVRWDTPQVDRFGRELSYRRQYAKPPRKTGVSSHKRRDSQQWRDPWSRLPARSKSHSRSRSPHRSKACSRSGSDSRSPSPRSRAYIKSKDESRPRHKNQSRSSSSSRSRSRSKPRSRSRSTSSGSSSSSSESSGSKSSGSRSSSSSSTSSRGSRSSSRPLTAGFDNHIASPTSPVAPGKTTHVETEAKREENHQGKKKKSGTGQEHRTATGKQVLRLKRPVTETPGDSPPTKKCVSGLVKTHLAEDRKASKPVAAQQQNRSSEPSLKNRHASALSTTVLPSSTNSSSMSPDSGVSLSPGISIGISSRSSQAVADQQNVLIHQGSKTTKDGVCRKPSKQQSAEKDCPARPKMQGQKVQGKRGKPTKQELKEELKQLEEKIAKKKALLKRGKTPV